MADYSFTISVTDLASIKMKEIEAAMASMDVKAKVETEKVESSFAKMGEGMAGTFKNLKSLLLTGLGITALFEGWEFIENSKEAFEGLEKQVARLDTVLKSTGFKAGFSSEDIQNQAKEVSKGIVNSRQEILQAQGTLLSFTNIRGDVFKKAFGSVADYATFFGTDLASGARILGRALQDPLQGMNQLRRAGIVLTAQQKEQIKNYEQSGQLVKAQSVLLDELNKKFGGQAQAYAFTDAGKIQVARKQWEELEFKLGEIISRVEVSLIPSFTKVINAIKGAFNSDTVQFFINHLKDLVSIVLKLLPIWLTYRAIIAANAAITAVFALENGILSASLGSVTLMTDGTTVAVEGLGSAMATLGIGALIVGIGLLIEKFISWNTELDNAVEKVSHLKDISEKINQATDATEKLKLTYSNLANLAPAQKSELLTNVQNQINENLKSKTGEYDPALKQSQLRSDSLKKIVDAQGLFGDLNPANIGRTLEQGKMTDATKELTKVMRDNSNSTQSLIKIRDSLKAQKVKPLSVTSPGSGVQGDAIHTSQLSGAQGGLGQAKEIKIYFNGPFQQNNGVHDLKHQANAAIEELTRMVNNMSDSVNAQ